MIESLGRDLLRRLDAVPETGSEDLDRLLADARYVIDAALRDQRTHTGPWGYKVEHEPYSAEGPLGAERSIDWWRWEVYGSDDKVILEGHAAEDPTTVIAQLVHDHNAADQRDTLVSLGTRMSIAIAELLVADGNGEPLNIPALRSAASEWNKNRQADARRAVELEGLPEGTVAVDPAERRRKRCPTCDGSGSVSPAYCSDDDFEPCPDCNGATEVDVVLGAALPDEIADYGRDPCDTPPAGADTRCPACLSRNRSVRAMTDGLACDHGWHGSWHDDTTVDPPRGHRPGEPR